VSQVTSPAARSGLVVVALCFLTIVFDGYDLIVYGSAVPSLLKEPGWNLGPAQAGPIGSYALAGMLIGALCAGVVTDAIGRRRIMLIGIAWFSLLMVACAFAPNPEMLGLGAIVGTVLASLLADRLGPKPVTVVAFLLAAACMVLLSQRVDTGLLMVAVAIAGLGSVVGPLFAAGSSPQGSASSGTSTASRCPPCLVRC
jgi:MFS family permease